MNALSMVVTAGALVGGGGWLAWSGWAPARPPLPVVLGRLGQPRPVELAADRDLDARIGSVARRVDAVERAVDSMRADLRILGRSPDEQAALMVTYTGLGLLWLPVVALGGWLVGVRLPPAIPLWGALVGGGIGAWTAIRTTQEAARRRRATFVGALSALCDVTGMCLASGRGVESSLETAARSGRGWAFQEIRAALRAGYVRGDEPWTALARLGEEVDVPDLVELAAALSLAGHEGAAVRRTVGQKAKAVRERLTTDAERQAASTTERMGVPATVLLFGFTVFLGYPALAVLFQ